MGYFPTEGAAGLETVKCIQEGVWNITDILNPVSIVGFNTDTDDGSVAKDQIMQTVIPLNYGYHNADGDWQRFIVDDDDGMVAANQTPQIVIPLNYYYEPKAQAWMRWQGDDEGAGYIYVTNFPQFRDDAASFTIASSSAMAIGGVFTADVVDANDFGVLRITANRSLVTTISDGTNFMPTGDAVGRSIFTKATQEGDWDIKDITGTISLPTGAATSAKQLADDHNVTVSNMGEVLSAVSISDPDLDGRDLLGTHALMSVRTDAATTRGVSGGVFNFEGTTITAMYGASLIGGLNAALTDVYGLRVDDSTNRNLYVTHRNAANSMPAGDADARAISVNLGANNDVSLNTGTNKIGFVGIQDRTGATQANVKSLADASLLAADHFGLHTLGMIWAHDGGTSVQPVYQTGRALHTLNYGRNEANDGNNPISSILCDFIAPYSGSTEYGVPMMAVNDSYSYWYPLVVDSSQGSLLITPIDAGGNKQKTTVTGADDRVNTTMGAANTTAFGYYFDGTAWDRMRGTSAGGLLVNIVTPNGQSAMDDTEDAIIAGIKGSVAFDSADNVFQNGVYGWDGSNWQKVGIETANSDTSLNIVYGAHHSKITCFDILNVGADTGYHLVDLSDTTNYPHTETGHIDLEWITVNISASKLCQAVIYLGFLSSVDATNGDLNVIKTYHIGQAGTNERTQISDTFIQPGAMISCQTSEWFGPTQANDTAWQTDVNLMSPNGVANSGAGNGDLVMKIDWTAGALDVNLVAAYHTEAA